MKKQDKFLIGIVAGIVLLVIVALVMALSQSEATYQADDTPEGVVHNYLLALQKEEYERAYTYLSPSLWGYPPTAAKFAYDVRRNKSSYSWGYGNLDSITLAVESVTMNQNEASVEVWATYARTGGDIFDSGISTRKFDVDLALENGEWKIINSGRYFMHCWRYEDGCD